MIPKVSKIVKCQINSILNNIVFIKLNKPRKDFIVSVLWHILSIKGKINFLQLGRFSQYSEQHIEISSRRSFISFKTIC